MKSIKVKQSITDRSDSSLNDYLKDISKYPLLSPKEEVEVATKAKAGDKAALNKLITSNLRFVVTCAKQYQGHGIDLIDLISEGNSGLVKAASLFDVDKGFRFISYAVWWIRQAILEALSNKSRIIRTPINQVYNSSKISKAIQEFEQLNERIPSEEELETILDIPRDKIVKIINSNTKMVSVDTPFNDDDGCSTLIEVIPNQNSPKADCTVIEESKKKEINLLLKKLTSREHDVIRMYFGIDCDPMTSSEISAKFGITDERARQIKKTAIKKLREYKQYIIND